MVALMRVLPGQARVPAAFTHSLTQRRQRLCLVAQLNQDAF